jgi:hypothetical protein
MQGCGSEIPDPGIIPDPESNNNKEEREIWPWKIVF